MEPNNRSFWETMLQSKVAQQQCIRDSCKELKRLLTELVAPGGAYSGYGPVIQGDNAEPHVDGAFHTFDFGSYLKS